MLGAACTQVNNVLLCASLCVGGLDDKRQHRKHSPRGGGGHVQRAKPAFSPRIICPVRLVANRMNAKRKFWRANCLLLIASLVFAYAVHGAQVQEASELRGTWTASAGSAQTFRGSWGAEISRGNPNSAEGWWTLVNGDERVMEGTWSVRKSGARWHGTWTARVTRRRSFSGSWDADTTGAKDKTFVDMLKRTIEKEVSGSWRSGSQAGNWWLQGNQH